MQSVDILEVETHLSRPIEQIETGAQPEIAIARNGRAPTGPVPLAERPQARRIGIAKGTFFVPASIDGTNAEIAALFAGEPGA